MAKNPPSIPQKPMGVHPPLSLAQQRLWFLYQLAPLSSEYNISRAWRLKGSLSTESLVTSFNLILARHEALRTTFQEIDGQPIQVIHPILLAPFEEKDFSLYSATQLEVEINRFLIEEPLQPFDLHRGPLLRFTLLRCGSDDHVLVFTIHHMVCDGYSLKKFCQELSSCYTSILAGQPISLDPLPIQYQDFAYWQERRVTAEKQATQLAFWTQQLQGAPLVLELPTDFARPKEHPGTNNYQTFTLAPQVHSKLKQLIQPQGITLFMALLSVFQILLTRYTGQRDILVGAPIAGRTHADVEGLMGFFVNTMVLRMALMEQASFHEVLQQTRTTCLAGYHHSALPFEKIVEFLHPVRDSSRHPVIQAIFQLRKLADLCLTLPNVIAHSFPVKKTTGNFDLHMVCEETESGIDGFVYYPQAIYSDEFMAAFSKHYQILLEKLIANPDIPLTQLTLLTDAERQQQLVQWNNTVTTYPALSCVHHLFESHVEKNPDAIAVVYRDEQLTYAQLNKRANQFANYLQREGVRPETRIGVCLEPSVDLLVSLLAIFKAGGSYVPLDPVNPHERLTYIINDADVRFLVTSAALQPLLPLGNQRIIVIDSEQIQVQKEANKNLCSNVIPENLAYVIYTSGSTGQPKGVGVTHHNMNRLFLATQEMIHPMARDVWTLFHSYAFDFSVWELWGGLRYGGQIVIVPATISRDPDAFHQLLMTHQVTILNQTPSAFYQLSEHMQSIGHAKPPALRWVIFGGEALEVTRLQPWMSQYGDIQPRLLNMYGITETTVHVTHHLVTKKEVTVAQRSLIGKPLPDLQVYLLDAYGHLVPQGVSGELVIGGGGLARGYWNRPALTATRFRPNAFTSQMGQRLYLSGDMGRHDRTGRLNYLGRNDSQIKLRGYRIELGEIEAALRQQTTVKDTVVLCREEPPGDKYLAAYVIPNDETVPNPALLRTELKAQLPEYMVPTAFVILDAFPLTSNGKVDRRALPVPNSTHRVFANSYEAPATSDEEMLAETWRELLQLEQVGRHDDFFALGGHSLLAIQVISRLRRVLQLELPLGLLFEHPTIAGFAKSLDGKFREPKEMRLTSWSRPESLPLSFAQERMWFLDQLEPEGTAYVSPYAFRVFGPLNTIALEKSLKALVDRHESLRTSFSMVDGRPTQVVNHSSPDVWTIVDLQSISPLEQERAVQTRIQAEASSPFNLSISPLFRATLLKISPQDHIIQLTFHHIITDGWSKSIFFQELATLYAAFSNGNVPTLPSLPLGYADFALWQRHWLQGKKLDEEITYWTTQLTGITILKLPTDRPRPPRQTSKGSKYWFTLSDRLKQDLLKMSQAQGCTLFMTLLAGFQTLLHRYTGQDDLVVGSPIAGRTHQELEGIIGLFINTLILRSTFLGNPTFRKILRQVRSAALGAYRHQVIPIEQVLKIMRPERDLRYPPLFQVLFVLQNMPHTEFSLQDLTVEAVKTDNVGSMFDVTLSMFERDGYLQGMVQYNSDLFDVPTIHRLVHHFEILLSSLVENPGQRVQDIPLLTASEQQQILVEWNSEQALPRPTLTIHQLFEQQVSRTPEATALVFDECQLTYDGLNSRANRLARVLQQHGVRAEVRVGLCLPRSLEMVMGVLAILKVGGVYVPLDPDSPSERLRMLLVDADIDLVITQGDLNNRLLSSKRVRLFNIDIEWGSIATQPMTNLNVDVSMDHLAYIIYTSGSTGNPKGVMVSHRSLVTYVTTASREFSVSLEDRVLQFASISFDASAEEIYPCLTSGGTLVLRPDSMLDSWTSFLSAVHQESLTVLDLPTAVWHELIDTMATDGLALPRSIRLVIIGGERAQIDRLRQWRKLVGDPTKLINTYGPTEATIVAITGTLAPTSSAITLKENVPLGTVLPHIQGYVLDLAGQPVPIGITGELFLGGVGIARGYLAHPELTADRFRPNPFSSDSGSRLYRTGDLLRYRIDGILEFVGRQDHQIKLRGYRIELGEIEAALNQHPSIQDTVVLCREDWPGEQQLVAYLVGQASPSALRSYLQERLPAYMLPSAFVVLEELPLTPNGKVDRRALPAPDPTHRGQAATSTAPRTLMEEIVATVWQKVLHVEPVGIHDNFFDLGGHSLLATQVISRVRTLTSTEVALRTLFDGPTIAQLAKTLEAKTSPIDAVPAPPLCRQPHEGPLPLSFAQQRLWFLDQWQPHSAVYNIPAVWRLRGALHLEALQGALEDLVARQEALRTIFPPMDGQARQHIQSLAEEFQLPFMVTDLAASIGDAPHSGLEAIIAEETARPFDLAHGPLFRVTVVRLSAREAVLLLTLHHIIADGWSMGVLWKEFSRLYEARVTGTPVDLPPLPVQYADYAVWQRQWLQGEVLAQQLAYWQKQLSEAPASIALPRDWARPAKLSYRGAQQSFTLPASVTHQLKAISQQEAVTVFMTGLAAFQVLLARYSGERDLVVGTPIANRTRQEIEGLIGFFVNTLVLRTRLTHTMSFRQFLQHVRTTCLEAYRHQDLPFEKLVEVLQPERDPSRHPLFQVMFQLDQKPARTWALTGLTSERMAMPTAIAKFDLSLALVGEEDGLSGTVEYSTDLFTEASITRFIGHFQILLESLMANPDQAVFAVPLLTEAERHQQLVEWNNATTPSLSEACIHHLFEAQVVRTPDAIAVVDEDQQLTYEVLNQRAHHVADHLRQHHMGTETLVGVHFKRSLDMIMALLGILKTGASYLPLETNSPQERLAWILKHSQVRTVLSEQNIGNQLYASGGQNGPAPYSGWVMIVFPHEREFRKRSEFGRNSSTAHSQSIAYTMYTSGSTGAPKGVMVPHHALVNHAYAVSSHYQIEPRDRVLQFASLTFDVAAEELFASLAFGATVVLRLEHALTSVNDFLHFVARHEVSLLNLPASYWHEWMATVAQNSPPIPPSIRRVVVGSEKVLPEHLATWQNSINTSAVQCCNAYGVTEATITTTIHDVLPDDHQGMRESVPIGRPISNTRIHVLDYHLQPVPIGVTGEIYIAGEGLARGYVNRPDLTAERFLPNPLNISGGERLYKTGDLGRYLPDGNLVSVGRTDHQIKLRGYRIELGEIEKLLQTHTEVRATVVLCREDRPGEKQLVAYLVGQASPSALRSYLQERLPAYMLPSAFVVLEELPLTPNGKVDRRALPAPEQTHRVQAATFTAPRTLSEELVATVWQEVLRLEKVSIHDNFFDLGGHSLLATQLIARLNQQLQMDLPLHTIFDHPILADHARTIEDHLLKEFPQTPDPGSPKLNGANFPGNNKSVQP